MPEYWIDTDVFIQAKNGPYAFDVTPEFWALLDSMNEAGRVASSSLVYRELQRVKDDLAEWARERRATAEDAQLTLGPEWARERRATSMFVEPDPDTQMAFQEVAQHVSERYDPNQAAMFLAAADPWLIAHAMASGGKVVTQETRAGENSKRVKIPNVCDAFGVESLNMDDMLRELGATIG